MTRRGWLGVILGSVIGLIVVLLAIGGFAAVVLSRIGGSDWEEATLQGEGLRRIAVVNITGEIHGGESAPSLFADGGAGAKDITSQLQQAADDDTVDAVILRIDSPGGAVVASDDIAKAVQRLRDEKPVVASMGDLAASGGYYIASQAETIFANRGTITGSIGVIAILMNLEGTAEKLGVEPIVLKTGKLKDAGSPFREMSDEDRAVYQRLLDQAYDQFVEVVAAGREMDEKNVRKLADGRPYSGNDAKENGLVDEFGDLDDAYVAALRLADLDRDEASLFEYRAPGGFGFPFGGLSGGGGVDDVRRSLGLDAGLKYLYLP